MTTVAAGSVAARLADGRLHLQHGPIDLIVGVDARVPPGSDGVDGDPDAAERAYARAESAFGPVLEELVAELPALRRRVDPAEPPGLRGLRGLRGPVARRMLRATLPWAGSWANDPVSSMAAVAGAVADHVLAAILAPGDGARDGAHGLRRAFVNDGGDVALHLADGEAFDVALCDDPRTGRRAATVRIASADDVGGIATSGRGGRSHSLGIADAVTVLARSAAEADVAATLIANAVDLPGSAKILRVPADELDPDSDLGERPVTVDVAPLSDAERRAALDAAAPLARAAVARGLALAVVASLQGETRLLAGAPPASLGRHASGPPRV